MIDLSEVAGLAVKFDEERGDFFWGEDITCADQRCVPLSEIIPVLLNKYLKYPEIVYKHSQNVTTKDFAVSNNLTYDLIYIPYGLLGIEYMKTHVYFSDFSENKYDCVVEVLVGNLTIVLQKNEDQGADFQYDTCVDEITIVNVKKEDKFAIPRGFFYTFVNTGLGPLIIAKVSANKNKQIDYSMLRKEKGLACYIISKNAKIETVANPKYKINCKLKPISVRQYNEKRKPMFYEQLGKNDEPLAKIMDKLTALLQE